MLIGLDEFPFHQTAESFAGPATGDPSWNDGHYLGVTDHDGAVSLTASLRLYPNNDVCDGFVCLRHEGRQHNLRVSRRLGPELESLRIGPLAIEIVSPLERLRLVLDDNESGIGLDLTCASIGRPVRSPVETTRIGGRLVGERTTYEVAGASEGTVEVAGERISLAADSASFFRNHSWGMQPGRGGPRSFAAPAPPRRRAPGVRQWVLFRMPGYGGHFFIDPSGRRASGRGVLMYPDRQVDVVDVEHDLTFHPGGTRLAGGTVRLSDAEGATHELAIEDLGWVYCQGGGYFGQGWQDGLGQGVYRGEYAVETDVWDVSHPTDVVDASGERRRFEHDWAESFTRLVGDDGIGSAHYECVVIGGPQ